MPPDAAHAADANGGSDCILLTRPDAESQQLAQALRELPVDCIVFPTLQIRPAEPAAAQIAAIDSLERFHLAIFVSANAVRHGLALVRSRRTWPVQVRVAAVGVATARALKEAGFDRVLSPAGGNDSEALLMHPALRNPRGRRILVVRGIGGREHLAATLRERGAQVEYLEAYRRAVPVLDPVPVRRALERQRLRAIVAASAEGVRNLVTMVGPELAAALHRVPLLVHHPRIAQAATQLGFEQVRLAPAEAAELVQVLRGCLRPE
jgi:uroporphyrinogen-III synthase